MSRSSSSDSKLGQLKEDLDFHHALLESLEDQESAEGQRKEIQDKVQSIEKEISKMQWHVPEWGSFNGQRSSSDHHFNGNGYSNRAEYNDSFPSQPANTTMTLPSRKRGRNAFDDEFDSLDIPDSKFIRTPTTTRTVSPARSVDSFDTNFSDDPVIKSILGDNYENEKRNAERYFRELENKKRREAEDAAFARQLQEEWANGSQNTSFQSAASVPASNYSQSLLQPHGLTYQRPVPHQSNHAIKSENQFRPNSSFTLAPVIDSPTPSSDDSGLEEISQSDWTSRFGSTQTQRRTFPPMMTNAYPYNSNNLQVPGAFPGLPNAYSSTPGASVYGNSPYNTSQYNSSTSSLGNMFNPLGNISILNDPFAGSSKLPFDLDSYPLPSNLTFADSEQTHEEIKDLLKHIRPDEELTPEQLAEIQPEGLNISLMPHQRKGFAWMKAMEEGTNKGGILADDMGLGKTVQALALVLGKPPAPDKDGRKLQRPTLIVAPVALMQQWEREIKKFVRRSHLLNVLILHGNNRNSSWNEIKNYDVVLTTYGLLASDFKRKVIWDKHIKMVPDARPTGSQQCPVLSEKSRFHRVILDEAQNIKNRNTKAATAACQIQADYRWCLSGTPMQNNIDEIYSLIKFCRIRPYNEYEKFSKDIGRPLKTRQFHYGRDKAMQQLQVLLRAILLRRTKKSEIDGQPILQLPGKRTVEDRTVFSQDELEFYKALEKQSQIQFNRYLQNGTVGRNYSHALVLLLRLRQCCCSPQLITNAKDFLVNGTLRDLDYVENAKLLPKDVIRRLAEPEAFECPICMDANENPIIFNPCGHSLCQECLSTMVDKAMADAESHKVTCPHCRAAIDTNKVTDQESFLRVHYPDRPGVKPLQDDNDSGPGDEVEDTDDSSDDDIEDDSDDGEDLRDFVVPDGDDVEYDTDASESTKKKLIKQPKSDDGTKDIKTSSSKSGLKDIKKHKSKDKKRKGKSKSKPDMKTLAQLRVEGMRSIAAKKKYLRRLGRGYQSSTKIEKTVQLLKDIRDNGEGEKTIIFSSFTSFLDLLEVAINREAEDIGTYTRYDGSMSAKDRNAAVLRFTDDAQCKAILVSLKAGNAGLNLTAANHVVILDPFWNPFVEYQAADRCYRIGQQREVTIHRILIGEGDEDGNLIERVEGSEQEFTVEDRILALQEKKRALVETALDETASGNVGRLGVRELGYLFGVNSMDG